MTASTFRFRTYGDAPHQFDFREVENLSPEMRRAIDIIDAFAAKKEKESHDAEPTVPFSFSEEYLDACYEASEKTREALAKQGYIEGEGYLQTPEAKLEWRYLGSKICNRNIADGDVSDYEITITPTTSTH